MGQYAAMKRSSERWRSMAESRRNRQTRAGFLCSTPGAVRHFAKATNVLRDGCIQATGWLASAARISPAANRERRLSPEPIVAAVRRGAITASPTGKKAPIVWLLHLDQRG